MKTLITLSSVLWLLPAIGSQEGVQINFRHYEYQYCYNDIHCERGLRKTNELNSRNPWDREKFAKWALTPYEYGHVCIQGVLNFVRDLNRDSNVSETSVELTRVTGSDTNLFYTSRAYSEEFQITLIQGSENEHVTLNAQSPQEATAGHNCYDLLMTLASKIVQKRTAAQVQLERQKLSEESYKKALEDNLTVFRKN